jgi:DNA primase catalytic subunit
VFEDGESVQTKEAELVVDGDADNLPDHLSEEDYKMCIDCQATTLTQTD